MLLPWEEHTSVPYMEQPANGADRPGIKLDAEQLDAQFAKLRIAGFRDKAAHLGVGVGTLHRAYNGAPVGGKFLFAVRQAFPRVAYGRLFREQPADQADAA